MLLCLETFPLSYDYAISALSFLKSLLNWYLLSRSVLSWVYLKLQWHSCIYYPLYLLNFSPEELLQFNILFSDLFSLLLVFSQPSNHLPTVDHKLWKVWIRFVLFFFSQLPSSAYNNLWPPLSHIWLFVTQWAVAHQASLSMGFPRKEYWSGFPFPPRGDLLDPGIKPMSTALQVDSLPLSCQGSLNEETKNKSREEGIKGWREKVGKGKGKEEKP